MVLKNNEGYIEKGDIDDSGKFIGWKDQIFYNANRLSGPNWMSGVSGERYLNEINIPGTHDSSMKNVSSKGCLSGSIGAWQATTQKGRYFGWFSMDASRANHYRDVWITNFPNDLDYCKVTVKSGQSGSDAPKEQTYKLLRGTEITIPGCIYSGTMEDRFTGWKAHLDKSASDDNDKNDFKSQRDAMRHLLQRQALWYHF